MRLKPVPAGSTAVVVIAACLLLLTFHGAGAARPAPAGTKSPAAARQTPKSAKPEGFSVGVNLDSNTDYSTDAAWVNVFHRFAGGGGKTPDLAWGRPTKPWEHNPDLELTPDGYPLADAGTFCYARGYPDGVYKFRMEGSGTPHFWGKGRIINLTKQGKYTLADVDFQNKRASMLMFRLTDIDPSDPPRDLRLIVPGLPVDTDRVHTDFFIEKLRPFTTIREMDRGRTNHSELKEWSDRVRPEHFCQTGPKGIAYEYMIALANESGKDLWVCVPDQATDEYMTEMAKLFREKLNPDCHLYVEYSNEWWNSSFRQHGRGKEAAMANPECTSSDPSARIRQHLAFKARQVGQVFRREFGNRAHQIRPVFAVQASDTWWAEVGLKFLSDKYGPPSKDIYALAGTSYFSLWEGDKDNPGGVDKPGMTLDEYFADLNRAVSAPRAKHVKHRGFAEKYGIRFIAYEGGLHVTDRNGVLRKDVNAEVKKQATDDPRMAELVPKIYDAWRRDAGDGMVMWFNFCSPGGKFGRWGLLESIDQEGSYKYDATVKYLEAGGFIPKPKPTGSGLTERPAGSSRSGTARIR